MKTSFNSFLTNSILCLILSLSGVAQEEFSFQLYFEDDNGNKDTLVLGFDPLASDSIDDNFGEVNLIGQPWDTIFEVRAIKRGFINGSLSVKGMSKKSIVTKNINGSGVTIAINKEATGVQMSWDSNIFIDSTVKGSSFIFLDCASPSNNNVILLKDVFGVYGINSSLFNCSQSDSVNSFRLEFKSKVQYVDVPVDENNFPNILIYPNPTTDNLIIDFQKEDNSDKRKLTVLNQLGQEVIAEEIKSISHLVSLDTLPKGCYFILIEESNIIVHTSSVVKQ